MVKQVLDEKLRNKYRIFNHRDLILEKIKAYGEGKILNKVGVIEFHPSDICDLNCFYCTYRWAIRNMKKEEKIYPFNKLDKIVELKPKAIVIVGGGEPTLYKDGNKTLNDLINYFAENISNVKIGLATNGVFVPKGKWIEHLEWVRISIDAVDSENFAILKDGSFQSRIKSLIEYLQAPIKYVGVGFLYNRFNISYVPKAIQYFYNLVMYELDEDYIKKLNIQFRPTCPIESCNCPSRVYGEKSILMTPDLHEWWHKQMENINREIKRLKEHKKLADFIKCQTNMHEITIQKKIVELPHFEKCFTSLIRWVIRPNGDVYPCVMKVSNKEEKIGNILSESLDTLTERAFDFYNLNKEFCKGPSACCRMTGMLNELIEINLHNDLVEVHDDPFF
ncbi:MAG: radical SAM protein [Candidatus Helarchaeota archaeon]